jgi:hypothetical protein
MSTIDITKLSAEERKELQKQFREDERQRKLRVKNDQEAYKVLVDQGVTQCMIMLQNASDNLARTKKLVYDTMESALKMKLDIFELKEDDQFSHTFSSADGRKTITIGSRTVARYDDTVTAGVAKVKAYIASLAKNDETANLVELVTSLMRPDRDGNLKPNRVLELKNIADKMEVNAMTKGDMTNNEHTFIDGVNIIINAYRPERTRLFVEARVKDENGSERSIPLSISTVD